MRNGGAVGLDFGEELKHFCARFNWNEGLIQGLEFNKPSNRNDVRSLISLPVSV